MADTPELDDTELRTWFRQHLDGLTPPGHPFDRARFETSTLPRLRGERPRRASVTPVLSAAVAASVLLLAVVTHLGVGGPGRPLAGSAGYPPRKAVTQMAPATAAGAPTASTLHAAVNASAALPLAPKTALPAHGVLTVVSIVPVGASAAMQRPAPLGGRWTIPARMLRHARAVTPGTYHCPAATQPATALVLRHGRTILTLTAYVAGCPWFTLAEGSHAVPMGRPAIEAAMRAGRVYWMPAGLTRVLKRLR
jgi:hypothetical protein